jgi:predicted component of viral defense system (DUF524 family)
MKKITDNHISLDITDNRGKFVAGLEIYAKGNSGIYENSFEEQKKYSEGKYLFVENQRYEFKIVGPKHDNIKLSAFNNSIVTHSSRDKSSGDIDPGNYTGLLPLYLVVGDDESEVIGSTSIEVTTLKLDTREHYRSMLDYIAEKSSDLIMQLRSPVRARFSPEMSTDIPTISQRFYFLKSLLSGKHFNDAIQQILQSPHMRSEGKYIDRNLKRGGFRMGASEIRQIASRYPRIPLSEKHPLYNRPEGLTSLPETVTTIEHHDYLDTPENRFVKHSLSHFSIFLDKMSKHLGKALSDKSEKEQKSSMRLKYEIKDLRKNLQNILSQSFFKEISVPKLLPLGSPVLQRKEGYRELLHAWLKFNTAAQLIWEGGNDVFNAGKRNIATLYEYWLFFKLLEVFCEIFKLDQPLAKSLIETTDDHFGLKLKAGKELKDITGVYKDGKLHLNVRLSYNRSFGKSSSYSSDGSWTMGMHPDYTISLWPEGLTEPNAEKKELIIHLHFDAKYKVHGNLQDKFSNIVDLFGEETGIDEKDENKTDTDEKLLAKRVDLLKMHAYKDAIKRSEGAYILYPGNAQKKWQGYKELLPGIGAFPVYPGHDKTDMKHVKEFLQNVVLLCQDKFSQLHRNRYWRDNIISDDFAPYGIDNDIQNIKRYHERYIPEDSLHPPIDTKVIIGGIRNEVVDECIKKGIFYFHAVNEHKETIEIPQDILSSNYLIPYSNSLSGTQWLGWFAKIKQCRLVSKRVLIQKEIIPQSQRDYYYMAEFEKIDGSFIQNLESFPTDKLPKRIKGPNLATWADLWKD